MEAEGFLVKTIVEPDSGKTHRIYSYKRKPCRRIVLKSRLCEQFAGYVLIEKDLRSVIRWLEEIERLSNSIKKSKGSFHVEEREIGDIIKGLFVAALTFYGKCFSKCEGRPVKLERVQLEECYRPLHDKCISYRHNFAAHSGAEKIEKVEVVLVFPEKYKDQVPFNIFSELDQPDLFMPKTNEISLFDLVKSVREVANKKIDKFRKRVEQDDVINCAERFWRMKV